MTIPIRGWLHRMRVLIAPASYAREVESEIRFHLEIEAMQARGDSASDIEAMWTARRRFGNVTGVREEVRRMSGIEWIDRVRQDVGYALRGLRQSPGFTAAVVITLGLGLGVNAAMFTFLDKVFVRPPAGVVRPNEVRRLYSAYVRPKEPNGRLYAPQLFYGQVRAIERASDSSVAIGMFTSGWPDSISIRVDANLIPVRRTLANTTYFRTLGVQPFLGRLFDANEDRIDAALPVAIISYALWQRAFNKDAKAVGSTIRIKDRVVTIIGVTPEGFAGIDLDRSDLWMPLGNSDTHSPDGRTPWYETYGGGFAAIARLPARAAEDRFIQIATRVAPGVTVKFWGDSTAEVRAGPLLAALGPAQRGKEISIALRLGAVALIVLIIAIANVSNLQLVRATRREREIAVRRALGVSRWRLFEQLFTESVLLALLGGFVSILLAIWAGAALRLLLLPQVNWSTGTVDYRTAAFAAAAALVVGCIVGLVPAIHAWRPDLMNVIKSGNKNAAYRKSRLRSALLASQSALSVVLLVGAGLFVRSLRNVQAIGLGFDVDRTMTVTALSDRGSIESAMDAAMPAIIKRLSSIDGVEAVAAASTAPMTGQTYAGIFLPGHDSLALIEGSVPAYVTITPGYFKAVGQRLLAGRDFRSADGRNIIVGESVARAYWPGEPAVGKCVVLGARNGPCIPVVGVVADVHGMRVLDDRQGGRYYQNGPAPKSVVVLRADPRRSATIARLATAEIQAMVPQAEFVRVRTMSDILEPEFRPWRLGATLFTAMGLLALAVAAVGVYSVIAYAMSQRTSEMGIRIALGARLADIARLVIGDGLRTVAAGIVVGVVAAMMLSKFVASLLYGISPRDPVVLVAAAVILALIGLGASIIPAIRAARVDPVTALRTD
jgi:putative ABC transport system permease protein